MNPDALPAVVILAVFAFIGWRATRGVFKRYRDIAPVLKPIDRLIGQAFVVVCLVISIAATVFGIVSVRSLLGFERIEWMVVLLWVISSVVFLIPPYLLYVYERIERG